jgi:hypothetical protein
MESIPQTDQAAIDNLASLKRPDGSACQSGDNIKFTADTGSGSSGIVCADADSCIIPCANGVINGTISSGCSCVCNLGYSGADCSTATPCPACQNGGTSTGSVAGGDCACACINGYTGASCEIDPPLTISLSFQGNADDYDYTKELTKQECFDNKDAILAQLRSDRGDDTITFDRAINAIGDLDTRITKSDATTVGWAGYHPQGCVVVREGHSGNYQASDIYNLHWNYLNYDPNVGGTIPKPLYDQGVESIGVNK